MWLVIDTGVIISAALKPDGTSFKAFINAMKYGTILFSHESFKELNRVLEKDKFKGKIINENKAIIKRAILLKGKEVKIESSIAICRNPSDDMFLNLALDGKADVIIS